MTNNFLRFAALVSEDLSLRRNRCKRMNLSLTNLLALYKPIVLTMALFAWCGFHHSLQGQRVLLNDPGKTYTNTDAPTFDLYGPFDITTCTSVRFELDFSFSLPWEGGGNMESSDECNFAAPVCPGDPNNPTHPNCVNCWDFLWAQFKIDGAQVGGDLIGEAGTTDAEQSGRLTLDYCTNGASTAQIDVTTQTWAANESVTFSGLMIICYEGIPSAMANPNPICDDEDLTLIGNLVDPGVVDNTVWTGPGTIDDPTALMTQVRDLPIGPAMFTLTTTDINGCNGTSSVTVIVHPTPDAFDAGPLEKCDEGNGQATFDLTSLDLTINGGTGDPVLWYLDPGLTNLIGAPNTFNSGPRVVYAVVDNGECQSDIIEVELIVTPIPVATPTVYELCEDFPGSGMARFELSTIAEEINGGTGLEVNFYLDPGGFSPAPDPYRTVTTRVYAKVKDGDCESLGALVNLVVLPRPKSIGQMITVCEDSAGLGYATIDFSKLDTAVNDTTGNAVEYYLDRDFLDLAANPYPVPLGRTTFYAKVIFDDCESLPADIVVEVLRTPYVKSKSIIRCEDPVGSGESEFNLDSLIAAIVDTQTMVNIEWFEDSLGLISLDSVFRSGSDSIYIRVNNGHCSSQLVKVGLEVLDPPLAQAISDTACADQSGLALFVLMDYDSLISNDARFKVEYSATMDFSIRLGANILSGDTTIYARVFNGACYSRVVPVNLVALPNPKISDPNDVVACDSFTLGGITGINLTGNEAYYTESVGMGTRLLPGDVIRSTTLLYIYDRRLDCFDEETYMVTIVEPNDAGEDRTISACEGVVVDLNDHIGTSATTGGSFEDIDGSGQLTGSMFNTAGLNGMTFRFRYIVPEMGPCGADSAVISVNVVRGLAAGDDNVVAICDGDTVDLLNHVVNADLGGSFLDINNTGALNNSIVFTEILGGPGSYDFYYKVGDGMICPEDSARITITIQEAIDIQDIPDQVHCNYFVLPQIISSHPRFTNYFSQSGGRGNQLSEGDTIYNSQQIFQFGSAMGLCERENSFQVEINFDAVVDIAPTICFNEEIQVGGQVFDISRPNGQVIVSDATADGCDSIYNISIDFFPNDTARLSRSLCYGQSLIINGNIYDENNPSGFETIVGGNRFGCDSSIIIDLRFDDVASGEVEPIICKEDSILINGVYYSIRKPSGVDTLFGQSSSGCDSVLTINVDFYEVERDLDSTLCFEESILINGTRYDASNPAGQEILSGASQFGCDSIVNIDLTFFEQAIGRIDKTLCFGQSIIVNGVTYDESNSNGTEVLVNGSVRGCDSTVSIALQFEEAAKETISSTICPSDSIVINGKVYHANQLSGTDTFKNGSSLGCDSILIIDLQLLDDSESFIELTLCPSEEVIVNGTRYDENNPQGTEFIVGVTANGCDSIIHVNLDFESFSITPEYQEHEIELGDSVQINLQTSLRYTSIQWSNQEGLSCLDCLNPVIKPTSSQEYIVRLTDDAGCEVIARIFIKVVVNRNIFIPNSFSPNGDGLNDRIRLFAKEGVIKNIMSFQIFDRWGELVYTEINANPDDGSHLGWNGTFNNEILNPSVFVYRAQVEIANGEIIQLAGNVTLLR